MRCSLYGKLPAKRDFVAVAAPRPFLNTWEPWMQGGISASRQSLGDAWQNAFLTAPIWRFWLGADLCGAPVIGPSCLRSTVSAATFRSHCLPGGCEGADSAAGYRPAGPMVRGRREFFFVDAGAGCELRNDLRGARTACRTGIEAGAQLNDGMEQVRWCDCGAASGLGSTNCSSRSGADHASA